MMKLKYLCTAALLLAATTSLYAQEALRNGVDIISLPDRPPYVYEDLLRIQEPYILHQYRQNNTSPWLNGQRFTSEKTANGYFTRLAQDEWRNNSWVNKNTFNYAYSYNTAGRLISRIDALSGDDFPAAISLRTTLNYGTNNMPSDIVVERAPAGSSSYTVISAAYFAYDTQMRLVKDSLKFQGIGSSFVTVYTYAPGSIVSVHKMLSGTLTDTMQQIFSRTNAMGLVTDRLDVSYLSNNRRDSIRSVFTYNSTGKVLSNAVYTRFDTDTSFVNSELITYQYRSDDQLDKWERSVSDNTNPYAWRKDYKLQMFYTGSRADSSYSYGWLPQLQQYATVAGERALFRIQGVGVEPSPVTRKTPVVYPNPATDQLFVSGLENGRHLFLIRNNTGQVVTCLQTSDATISIAQLPAGIYYLSEGDGPAVRFIKQ